VDSSSVDPFYYDRDRVCGSSSFPSGPDSPLLSKLRLREPDKGLTIYYRHSISSMNLRIPAVDYLKVPEFVYCGHNESEPAPSPSEIQEEGESTEEIDSLILDNVDDYVSWIDQYGDGEEAENDDDNSGCNREWLSNQRQRPQRPARNPMRIVLAKKAPEGNLSQDHLRM